MVQVIRESQHYIWLKFFNRTVKTTKGSIISNYIEKLEEFLENREIKAFTSYEFSQFSGLDTTYTSKFLNVMVSQQVLEKTKKRLLFRDSTNLENVWGLTKDDILNYIIDRLCRERKEIVEDFERLKEEKVLTSLDVKHPQQLRIYFAQAVDAIGVIRTQNFDIFYYGDYQELEDLIRIKESEAMRKVITKVKRGISFERKVEEFFRNHQHELHFRCVDIKRYSRHDLGDDKTRVFDLVLYFRLYVGSREVPGFPTLVVPVEIKKTETGQAVLLKHLIECLKIFSHNFVPLVVTSKPVRSAFDTLSLYKIALLTDSDLKSLEEGDNVKGEGTEDIEFAIEWAFDS
jgi:hypothetical protein